MVFGWAYIFIQLEDEFLRSCEFQGDFFKILNASTVVLIIRGSPENLKTLNFP